MALILPNRFYRQPTTTLIDQGNPISRGLNAGYLASTRSFFGAASSAHAVANGTYKYNPRFGVALRNNFNSSSMAAVRQPIGVNSDATVLSVFLPSTPVAENYSGHLGQIGSGFSLGITIGNGSASVIRGRAYLNGATGYFGGGTTITNFDKPIVGVVRQKYNVEQALFIDGIKDATTSAVTGGTLGYGFIGNAGVGSNFGQFLLATWARALSDAEIWELAQDPYQIFHRPNRRIWVNVISSGVTGALAKTNANDTVSASGTTTVTGALARTNANDTVAASGTTTIVGTLDKTNANDSVSASGTTTVTGTLAKTNANDTCVASGAVGSSITGTVATANANDTVAASGTTTVTGTLAKTNTNDSVSAIGTTTIVGSLATTNANDVCVASGAAGAVTGTVAYTNASDTLSASGTAGSAQVGGGGVGYGYGYVKRKKSIKEEREKLGIIPKTVEKIIEKIAEKNDSYALEPVAKVELKANLERKGLQFKSTYEDALIKEIERNININLASYLKKQKDIEDRDDEEAAMWLLM